MKREIYFLFFVLAISTGGCKKDFFKLEFPPQPLIVSMASLNQAVGGVYYAMMANDGSLSTFDHLAVYAAAVGDEGAFISTAGNITSVRELYDRNNSTQNIQLVNAFIPAYDAIRHAGLWLTNINNGTYASLDGQDQLPTLKRRALFPSRLSVLGACKDVSPTLPERW